MSRVFVVVVVLGGYRQKDCLLRSTRLDHGHASDHIVVVCQLDIVKPLSQPETAQFRSLNKMDKTYFKHDLAQSITQHTSITDFNKQLRFILDKHAPLRHRTVRQRKPTLWFSIKLISELLGELKRERRRAERRLLKSKLTVYKQIYKSIKREVADLVDKAKTTFLSSKIQANKTCKELFQTSAPF